MLPVRSDGLQRWLPRVAAHPAPRLGEGSRPEAAGSGRVAAVGAWAGIPWEPGVAAGPTDLTGCGLPNGNHRIGLVFTLRHQAATPKCPKAVRSDARYSSVPTRSGSINACTGYPMIRLTATAATPAGMALSDRPLAPPTSSPPKSSKPVR